jgi:hypothetical protein
MSLAGRSGDESFVETESGTPGAPRLVTRATLGNRETSGVPRNLVVQVEDDQPLDTGRAGNAPELSPPDLTGSPRTRLIARKAVVRAAGKSLVTRVYQTQDGSGLTWQVWCSQQLHPLGVARLLVRGQTARGPLAYEMIAVATGRGAKPRVVRPSVPYTEAALFAQFMKATR